MSVEIGLLVPNRATTPSDGRAQHYQRPGYPCNQQTRTFGNGTTLTFGADDPVDKFLPGEAFFDQCLVIEGAVADIQAVLDRYSAVKPAGLNLDKENLAILDTSLARRSPSRARDFSSASLPPTQIGGQEDNKISVPIPKLSFANAYQSPKHIGFPGNSHPGLSTDTRFGSFDFPEGSLHRTSGVKGQTTQGAHRKSNTVYPGSRARHQDAGCRGRPKDMNGKSSAFKKRSRFHNPRPRHHPQSQNFQTPLPYGPGPVPMPVYPNSMSQMQMSMTEYFRWLRLKQELIIVPFGRGKLPSRAYIIEPSEPINHPNIFELHGPPGKWDWLVEMNANNPTNGQRSQAMEDILDDIIFGKEVETYPVELPLNGNRSLGEGGSGIQNHGHSRQDSDVSSVWHMDLHERIKNENNVDFGVTQYTNSIGSGGFGSANFGGTKSMDCPKQSKFGSENFGVIQYMDSTGQGRFRSSNGVSHYIDSARQRGFDSANASGPVHGEYVGYITSSPGEVEFVQNANIIPYPLDRGRMCSKTLGALLSTTSRQSSPGYANFHQAQSQFFGPPARPASAADFTGRFKNQRGFR